MANKYNIHLIKERASYSVEEISNIFRISKKTCFRWIETGGLKLIEENTKPVLIMGKELKEYLLKKRKKRKVVLQKERFFCMKCRQPVKAQKGSERVVETGRRMGKERRQQILKTAICEFCETKVNKFLGVYQQD